MKNKLAILSITALFFTAVPVFADTVCGNPANSTVTTMYITCGSNGNPENVTNIWGGTNSSLPHVTPGASIVDEGGVPLLCPTIVSNYCVDISHTDYYRNAMLELGRQLKSLGQSGGIFGYWIAHV